MRYVLIFPLCFLIAVGFSQPFSSQDSLRGSITKERAWWDLKHYDLRIQVDIDNQLIDGSNHIYYEVMRNHSVMQIDLQPPMNVFKVTQLDEELNYTRSGNVYYIKLKKDQKVGDLNRVEVFFKGKPKNATNPPWESGIVWSTDSLGLPFAASVSWGAGSSQWWPCKDHSYDEADSIKFSINVPKNLVAVGNGRLVDTQVKNSTKTYHWSVANPINTYGINFNIGNYADFSKVYNGEKGPLKCNFFVLEYNLKKAKKHFEQVFMMLEAFEHWFGPYPFYEDSYKIVEVPYIGMEHQSATAYGNGYQNGYMGYDQSHTGWGNKWDLLIVHESAHEWFAGNITFKDIADIWIHESFTTYSEGLFTEYHYGKKAGYDYLNGIRKSIKNDKPLIGQYEVNDLSYTSDNYQKGAVILHMLRQVVDNDTLWRSMLRGLNKEFYHQTVTTHQIEKYISNKIGIDLNNFWDQYLRTTQIPVFEYYFADNELSYRWINCIEGFDMPLKIKLNEKLLWVYPKRSWQSMTVRTNQLDVEVDRNFYVPSLFSNRR